MKAELQHKEPKKTAPIQSKGERSKLSFVDNRKTAVTQSQIKNAIQKKASYYEKPLSGDKIRRPFYHAHIGFDEFHTFPYNIHIYQPNESSRSKNALVTNYTKDIGFGAAAGFSKDVVLGGPGEFFTYFNGIESAGGEWKYDLSKNSAEDSKLIYAINKIGPNHEYTIGGYNCQTWYQDVKAEYEKIRDSPFLPWLDPHDKKIFRENAADTDFYTSLLGSYYGAYENWDEKQPGLELVVNEKDSKKQQA